jgi:hypothetical protein
MPSQRYYRERARTLLAWARATNDKAYAAQLRLRAANELEQAQQARETVAGLTSLHFTPATCERKTRPPVGPKLGRDRPPGGRYAGLP